MEYRIESDSLGPVEVPRDAYWGSQAERSRRLFPISGLTEHPMMIDAFVMLKRMCAEANASLGLIDKEVGASIVQAADEILSGKMRDQFPVDVFHMGAGTSFNMNVNEVLANRAEEILGGRKARTRRSTRTITSILGSRPMTQSQLLCALCRALCLCTYTLPSTR